MDTIKIAYTEYGSGENLIFLHGNSGNKGIFKKHQLRYFKGFHTFAIDSRGHGQSVSSDKEYSIRQYADDVINFCKSLGIKKAYAAGYSDGGNICLFLAQKAPDVFEKVTALSPNYLAGGNTDEALRFLNRMKRIILFLEKLRLLPKRVPMRWELMLKDIGITEEELVKINADMLILYAEKDMIKEEHTLKMAELIPNCKVKKIAKTNHLNIYKNENTVKEIKDFIAE
ncbi:MAG: alpha/beta hydrolase [Treponema sp.]|nr:alpha/beta hydrolase [Treponema sp.]